MYACIDREGGEGESRARVSSPSLIRVHRYPNVTTTKVMIRSPAGPYFPYEGRDEPTEREEGGRGVTHWTASKSTGHPSPPDRKQRPVSECEKDRM